MAGRAALPNPEEPRPRSRSKPDRDARDGADQRPATAAFQPEDIEVLEAIAPTVEGRTERLRNPFPPRSLPWVAWIIARLGGWHGARNAKPPGPITMHRGLQCF